MAAEGYEPGPADYRIAPPVHEHHTITDGLSELLTGEFQHATTVLYHGLTLYFVGDPRGNNVWEVYRTEAEAGEPLEVLNLGAFRTATELGNCLGRLRTEERQSSTPP